MERMHESSRHVRRGNYVVIGRRSNKTVGYKEHIVCNARGARRRDEKHVVANRLLAPSREGAPGCSVLCVRYWTDTIFAFSLARVFFLSLSLPPPPPEIAYLFLFLSTHPAPSLAGEEEGP